MIEMQDYPELNGLIESFYQNKQSLDNYKKLTDEQNSEIKSKFKEIGIEKYVTLSGKTATLTIAKKESFDDDKLLERIKSLGFNDLIKTKEYVDMNELENVIYNGELDASDIADCRIIKEVEMLRIKERK